MKGRDEEEETPLLPTIREQKAQTARKQKWQAGSINKLLPRKKMNTITRRAPVKVPNAPSLSLSLSKPKMQMQMPMPTSNTHTKQLRLLLLLPQIPGHSTTCAQLARLKSR